MGMEEVFNQIERGNMLRQPKPMKSDPNRRNQNKLCRFHGGVGHNTNDCVDLEDEMAGCKSSKLTGKATTKGVTTTIEKATCVIIGSTLSVS